MATGNHLAVVAGRDNTAARIHDADFEEVNHGSEELHTEAPEPEQMDIEDDKKKGHNSKIGGIAAGRLLDAFLRIEKLEQEKKDAQDCINDIFKEMTGAGFDKKAMKECLRRRKMGAAELSEMEDLIDTYEHAVETELHTRNEAKNPSMF